MGLTNFDPYGDSAIDDFEPSEIVTRQSIWERLFFTYCESPPLPFRWERVREFGVLQGFVATKLDLGSEYKESFSQE